MTVIEYQDRTVRRVSVNPQQAKLWLDTVNTHNRNHLPRVSARYAKVMREGRWRPLVGEPISFGIDDNGNVIMLNGQQRCYAIIASGTTQEFLVLEGLPIDDQDVMDSGANRKTGQAFTIKGWKNGNQTGSVVRVLLQWHTGTLLSSTYSPDTDECLIFAERYRSRVEASVSMAMRVRRNVPLLPSATGAVAFTAFDLSAQSPEKLTVDKITEFFTGLESGAGLEIGSPILALRNLAVRMREKRIKVEPPREVYNIVTAWNAWRRSIKLERIQVPRNGGVITERHITMNP